jgi:hypothetical protein
MLKIGFLLFALLVSFSGLAIGKKGNGMDSIRVLAKPIAVADESASRMHKVSFTDPKTGKNHTILVDSGMFELGWDRLPQVNFWKSLMCIKADSSLISVQGSREILQCVPTRQWNSKPTLEREYLRDSLKRNLGFSPETRILQTEGRSGYYLVDEVLDHITKSIEVFEENGVDPFYAQAILLIESPGRLSGRSPVGAYGPFQLMPYVGKQYGLRVGGANDERADLERSAYAASMLIKKICVPMTEKMLQNRMICYSTDELWFKMLVMHTYHAGAGNVMAALNQLQPKEGGMELIQQLWRTEAGGFRNASQNYSQIAMAANIRLAEEIRKKLGIVAIPAAGL